MTATIILQSPSDRAKATDWIRRAPEGSTVTFERPGVKKRTNPQNDKMHAMIRDVQQQVKKAGFNLDEEDWKRLFVHQLWKETRLIPDLDETGGFVLLGKSTKNLKTHEMADMILLIQAYGDQHGVVFKSDAGLDLNRPLGR